MSYTPGPWTAQPDPKAIMGDDWCIGAQGYIDMIAVCSERDARLIAAAPDLYEALKEIVDAADGTGWDQLEATFTRARAALKKARGEK